MEKSIKTALAGILSSKELSTSGNLLPQDVKPLKRLVKQSHENIRLIFNELVQILRSPRKNDIIKLNALHLSNHLVTNSSEFRALLALDIFLCTDVIITKTSNRSVRKADNLIKSVIDQYLWYLVEWDLRFGDRHKQFRAMVKYLRDTKLMQLPDILASSTDPFLILPS